MDAAIYDQEQENQIRELTNALKSTLVSIENIMIAAHIIGDRTPAFLNSSFFQFWSDHVIPNLVQTLKDDVKLRALIADFLSSIRNLSISIQESARMVRTTKGTSSSISTAATSITSSIKALEDCIAEGANLNTAALGKATNRMIKLYGMIQSHATNFDEQKTDIQTHINEYEAEAEEYKSKIKSQKDELNDLEKLVRNLEQLVEELIKRLKKMKNSTDDLSVQNVADEQNIESIPERIEEVATETCSCRFWCRNEHRVTRTVKNSKGLAHANQIRRKVEERKKQIQNKTTNYDSEAKYLTFSEQRLNSYKDEYVRVQSEIQEYQKKFEIKMENIQKNIAKLRTDVVNIEGQAFAFRKEFGSTITDNFIQVGKLHESLRKVDSIYSQIVAILKVVKMSIQESLALLTSGSDDNAAHASKRLLKQSSFLMNYYNFANDLLQPTPTYKALTSAT